MARDYAGASAAFNHLPRDFTGMNGSLALALTAAASGDSAVARAHADTVIELARRELARSPAGGPWNRYSRAHTEAQMAVALALLGRRDAATRLAESSVRTYGLAKDAVGGATQDRWLALTYTLVGRKTDAIAVLERMLAVPSNVAIPMLKLLPWYDGLRGEPAFQRLIATPP
jgi:hypothetical protein